MKKKRWGIYFIVILVLLSSGIFYYFYISPYPSVKFQKASVDCVLSTFVYDKKQRFSIFHNAFTYDTRSKNEIKIKGIPDYTASEKVDPKFRFKENGASEIYMIDEMDVRFSQIEYEIGGVTKKADVGNYHLRNRLEKALEEGSYRSKENNTIEVTLLNVQGVIKEASVLNKDANAKVKSIKNPRTGVYVIEIAYSTPKAYDIIYSSLSYKVEENDMTKEYYGSGFLVITRKGAGGSGVASTTIW